jgi:hypothetical protein
MQKEQKPKRVESILFEEFPILNDLEIINSIICREQKKAEFVCINNGCIHYPFLCSDKLCECKKEHKTCLKILIDDFMLKIEQNVTYLDMLI